MQTQSRCAAILDLIEQRGLTLTQAGKVWRTRGFGLDIATTDLKTVTPDQLRPYQRRKGQSW